MVAHWIFKQGDTPFFSSGIKYVQPFPLQQSRPPSMWESRWGEFADYGSHGYPNAAAFWMSKQIHDLLFMNVNTLGYLCKLVNQWQHVYYHEGPPESYDSQDFWTEVKLFKQVNNHLTEAGWWVEGMPTSYPFAVNINIVPGNHIWAYGKEPDCTLSEHLPDPWSSEFAMLAYRRAYLMCADKSKVHFLDIPEEYPFPETDGVRYFPLKWQKHKAQAMCNQTPLLCYFLGNDLHFGWRRPDQGGEFQTKMWWMRKLISHMVAEDEPSDSKKKFAEIMGDLYNWSTDDWNDRYGYISEEIGFYIHSFLGTSNPPGYICLEDSFGEHWQSNAELRTFLDQPGGENDLGWFLTKEDREVFLRAMADTLFHLSVDAIREFDAYHLISSPRLGFCMGGEGLKPIVQEASRYCDLISIQTYPDPLLSSMDISPDSSLAVLEELYSSLCGNSVFHEVPFLICEFSNHANWEKGYARCCGRGEDGDMSVSPCPPADCETQGDDDYYKPCPCCESCEDLSDCTPWPWPEMQYLEDRGDAYCDWTRELFWKYYPGEPENICFVAGWHWYGHYDHIYWWDDGVGFCTEVQGGERGETETLNWGLKDTPVIDWNETEQFNTTAAYYEDLTDMAADANGEAQLIVTGNTFSGGEVQELCPFE